MRALRLVELERAGERLQHVLRHTARVAPLEPGVVVDADAGEQRDLLAAQPGTRRLPPYHGQPGPLRSDPRTPRGQELTDLVSRVHRREGNPLPRALRGPASTRIDRVGHRARALLQCASRSPTLVDRDRERRTRPCAQLSTSWSSSDGRLDERGARRDRLRRRARPRLRPGDGTLRKPGDDVGRPRRRRSLRPLRQRARVVLVSRRPGPARGAHPRRRRRQGRRPRRDRRSRRGRRRLSREVRPPLPDIVPSIVAPEARAATLKLYPARRRHADAHARNPGGLGDRPRLHGHELELRAAPPTGRR